MLINSYSCRRAVDDDKASCATSLGDIRDRRRFQGRSSKREETKGKSFPVNHGEKSGNEGERKD